MKVLITGAFGNIGFNTVNVALKRGYKVRCFDLNNPANLKRAKQLSNDVEIVWGDLTKPESIANALIDIDAVIHLAGIIPPLSERNQKLCKAVNVDGTKNIVAAIKSMPKEPRFIFSSSLTVFGYTQDKEPPRRITEPVNPTDFYSKTKVDCEKIIEDALQNWTILRLGAATPVELTNFDPVMFSIPLKNRIEFVHPKDVALALVNAIEKPESNKKKFLIGGGPSCQMFYRDYVTRVLSAFGIGKLPDNAFQKEGAYYTDWLDTEESQRILQFQETSFETYAQEVGQKISGLHVIIEILKGPIKLWLLGKSPYLKANKEAEKAKSS